MHELTPEDRMNWLQRTTLATAWTNLKTVQLLRSGVPEEEARMRSEMEYQEKLRGGRGEELAAELAQWFMPS